MVVDKTFTKPSPFNHIPNNWTLRSIGSLCLKVTSGGTPSRANPNFYKNGDTKWIKTKELKDWFIDDSEEKITLEALENSSAKLFPANTVLMAMYGDGKTITSLGILREAAATNQACCAMIVDPESCHYLYLFYSLKYHREDFIRLATGGAQRNLSSTMIRNFSIILPPLPEQRAIAHILGSLDDKIELNRRMNETLESIARALFKSWFVDFDPVRAKMDGRQPYAMDAETAALFPDGFENSVLGEIPRGWRVASLPEIVEINPSRSLHSGQVAPYLEMSNMPNASARALAWENRAFSSGIKFINGDTLVARITPCLENGKTAFVDFLTENEVGWGSTEYIVFRSRPPLPLEYSYFVARTDEFRTYAIRNMTGTSGRQRVATSCFNSYSLIEPSRMCASIFGNVTHSIMKTMKQHDEESQTLTALRDTLLPKLLSGEIRVKDAERAVEAAV